MWTVRRRELPPGGGVLFAALTLCCAAGNHASGTTRAAAQDPPPGNLEPARRSPTQMLEDGYRDRLVAWAKGDTSQIAAWVDTELWAVEKIAGAPVTPQNLFSEDVLRADACVREVAGATSLAVGAEDPEALLAIAVFEFELYHDHRRNLRPGRADSAWRRVEGLRSSYRRNHTVTQTAARRRRALLATYMASGLTSLSLLEEQRKALTLFEQAVELEPGNVGAAYWEAFLREKFGLYKKAVQSLGRLAVLRPDDWEVKLRWGLNLARTGSLERAEERLAEVVAGARENWIGIVAFQELARLRLGRDRELGIRTLRQALEAHPTDERLRTALAFFLGPASAEARALARDLYEPTPLALEGGPNGSGQDRPPAQAPRLRYEDPRQEDVERELLRFESLLREAQRALAAAVAAVRKAEQVGLRKRASIRHCRKLRTPG